MSCTRGRCMIPVGVFLIFVGFALTGFGNVSHSNALYVGPVFLVVGVITIISAIVIIKRENAATALSAGAVIQPYHATVINQNNAGQPLVGGYPPVQQGYPQQAGAGGYPPPPQQGYPPPRQQGYPPPHQGYPPPPQQGYPPPQQQGYQAPSSQQSYPPPQQQSYPAPAPDEKGGYPPPAYLPPQGVVGSNDLPPPPPYEATPNAPPPE